MEESLGHSQLCQVVLHGHMETSRLCAGLCFGKAFPISFYSFSPVLVLQGRLSFRYLRGQYSNGGAEWARARFSQPVSGVGFSWIGLSSQADSNSQSPQVPRKLGPSLMPTSRPLEAGRMPVHLKWVAGQAMP